MKNQYKHTACALSYTRTNNFDHVILEKGLIVSRFSVSYWVQNKSKTRPTGEAYFYKPTFHVWAHSASAGIFLEASPIQLYSGRSSP
jgi:hypothetical protein